VYNGVEIRDSYNGPIPISKYGMVTYFKEKADEILAAGIDNCDVVSSYDGKHDELNITFHVGVNKETVVFHESRSESERVWSHYASFTPDNYAYFGNTLIASEGDKLWKHNSGLKNNFYGEQYNSVVRLIFNQHPLKNKAYQNIQIKASGDWRTKAYGDIYILDESGNVLMSSYLPESKFKSKEGAVYATFLRNALTTGDAFTVQKLLNGEVLRGRFLVVTLTNEDTAKAWLSHVVVSSISSELS
jgi:hypothetical protein